MSNTPITDNNARYVNGDEEVVSAEISRKLEQRLYILLDAIARLFSLSKEFGYLLKLIDIEHSVLKFTATPIGYDKHKTFTITKEALEDMYTFHGADILGKYILDLLKKERE